MRECPKCGGRPSVVHGTDYFGWRVYYVRCMDCGHEGPRVRVPYGKPEQPYEQHAIEKWNRRRMFWSS